MSDEKPEGYDEVHSSEVYLQRISRDIKTILGLVSQAVNYLRDAESEIPEKYRRFVNAFHDVHDIKWVYEESGHDVPAYILRELERLDDRYRQILNKMYENGGAFDKVRREMADDKENKWDHMKFLEHKIGVKNETR